MTLLVETSIIVLIVINGLQLISHFVDKLGNSECTGENHKVSVKMKHVNESS